MSIRYVDLFSGIGGFRLACEQIAVAGIHLEPVASAEIDPVCRKVYSAVFTSGDHEVLVEDVREITDALKGIGPRRRLLPKFDLLLAGFPCQTFSNVGLRDGLDDPRGRLFYCITTILREYKPRLFILENVQKLATIGRGALLKQFVSALKACGYDVTVWDLNAADYGLPHQRRRIFFCGERTCGRGSALPMQEPPTVSREKSRYPTVWHLLEKTMPSGHLIPTATRRTVLRRNPKWEGDLFVNRPVARPLTATMHKWHRANQDNYYTKSYIYSKDPKSLELLSSSDVGDQDIRRITPLEGFRLQGFPDTYARIAADLGLSKAAQYRMIGNAVPVDLARAVIEQFLSKVA